VSFRKTILVVAIGALALLAGCASRTTRVSAPAPPPALTATRQQLLDYYQQQAAAIHSLHAAIRLKAETGSAFSGAIKSYHQITALFVAERPDRIRVVGQAPVVGTDIFDMVSDGKTFHMYVPSKKRFIVGPASGGQASKNTIENLRPQPLFDALIWQKVPAHAPVLIEQEDRSQPASRYYVLTVLRQNGQQFEIDRRIWFDRSDLRVARIETFGSEGRLESEIDYSDWRQESGTPPFPWHIVLWRPAEHYRLELDLTAITLNPSVPPGSFTLTQPPGSTRVDVGQTGGQS
jgi:outer membrane lipoprotein-sorting protein